MVLVFNLELSGKVSDDITGSPGKQDATVHDGGSDDGHGVALVLDAVLTHAGVTDGHVHALIHH